MLYRELHEETLQDMEAMVTYFTNAVIAAGNIAILVVGGILCRPPVPLCNDDCTTSESSK